jgi:hypothetical protein
MVACLGGLMYLVSGLEYWRGMAILFAVLVLVQCFDWLHTKGREDNDAL